MKLFGNRPSGGEHTEHAPAPVDAEIDVTEVRSDEPEAESAGDAPKKKKKVLRRVFITLGAIVLAILLVLAYFWFLFPKAPNIAPPSGATQRPDGAATLPPAVDANGDGVPDDPSLPVVTWDEGEAPTVPMDSKRRDGVYTFLVAGTDRASNSTDTILVVSFDTKEGVISCTSIPRDTMVNIGWANTPKKINAVYPGYINSGKDGIEGLKTYVKKLLGFDVDCYVVVDLQAVVDIVDTIGGVWFYVDEHMEYYDLSQDLYITIWRGYQLLDGDTALKLCRFRAGYPGADLDRIKVQQRFLKSLAGQVLSLGTISYLPELVDVIERDVDTDLTSANLFWLAQQFMKCRWEDITFQTLPNINSGVNDLSLVGVDVTPWLAMINASINPYVDDVTLQNVDILTYGAGGGVYATSGVIAGGIDSFYCPTCTSKTGHVTWHAPGAHLPDEEEPENPEETGDPGGETGPGTEPDLGAEPTDAPDTETPVIEPDGESAATEDGGGDSGEA